MSPLSAPVTTLPGLGPKRAAQLAKLGLLVVGDFLTHFPRAYEDRTREVPVLMAIDGDKVCVRATVAGAPVTSQLRKGLSVTKCRVFDETGMLHITFFNNPYVKSRLMAGEEYIFFGQIEARGGQKSMLNPLFEAASGTERRATGRIVPVYPLTAGISQKLIAEGVDHALGLAEGRWEELLPSAVIEAHGLCEQAFAYEKIHFPDDFGQVEVARRRLIFEELFVYGCASRRLKQQDSSVPGILLEGCELGPFWASLPFAPTGAQRRAVSELAADMASGTRMNRLLQGDVGSGKTLVAAAGAWLAAQSGAQSAIMAPTELLASQHFDTFRELLEPHGIRVALLTSGSRAAEKRAIKAALAAGEIDVLCGTHALIQGDVAFARAGLMVVDEQHRFGVRQRAALREKAPHAHLLVMSATPIPRTLTLIIYGDLQVSILDELPPGRQPVQTFADGEARRARILRFLEKQISEGGQAYIVCPLIEDESGQSERTAATEYAENLRQQLPDLRIGLMHGKLKTAEKDAVMAAFAAGELDVLVSTTVIEVGVNVPNATLMLVENADLFGLSQLHQLRGRVGRGARQSYCILMSREAGEVARQRLATLCGTHDGFKIAEEDLRLRGPGDFFGDKQHGLPEFKIAGQAGDTALIVEAMEAAARLCGQSPGLEPWPALAMRVAAILSKSAAEGLN